MSDDYPACPSNLAGILTAPMMDPQYITALEPFGAINPPGHTAPVDHTYFSSAYDGPIPLYAPADALITQVIQNSVNDGSGKYVPTDYVVQYVICRGLVLDFAGYLDIIPDLKTELDKQTPICTYGITKPGHNDTGEGQCYYQLNFPVKSGEQIGYTHLHLSNGVLGISFEIWAANYNQPSRSDVDWSYYQSDRYAHAICTFDLYSGDLKSQFYQKFGLYMVDSQTFTPRTIEPLCGQINQDIPGTIQGMWFGAKPIGNESPESKGLGLAFLYYYIDPTKAEISIGGNITDQAAVIFFTPTHSGLVDREPSEVTADGQVYCYNSDKSTHHPYWDREPGGKMLVQLFDAHHLKVEHQSSSCTANETFVHPFTYER